MKPERHFTLFCASKPCTSFYSTYLLFNNNNNNKEKQKRKKYKKQTKNKTKQDKTEQKKKKKLGQIGHFTLFEL